MQRYTFKVKLKVSTQLFNFCTLFTTSTGNREALGILWHSFELYIIFYSVKFSVSRWNKVDDYTRSLVLPCWRLETQIPRTRRTSSASATWWIHTRNDFDAYAIWPKKELDMSTTWLNCSSFCLTRNASNHSIVWPSWANAAYPPAVRIERPGIPHTTKTNTDTPNTNIKHSSYFNLWTVTCFSIQIQSLGRFK